MFERVASCEELWPGEMRRCVVHGDAVLLVNVDGTIVAYQDRCAHLGAPLSAGQFKADRIVCAVHRWEYDARTGLGINPRSVALTPYAVEIRDGSIFVNTSCTP